MSTAEIAPGTKVTHTNRITGERLVGIVTGTDPTHYHSVVNGRTVYVVQWFGGIGPGSGWSSDDLRTC